MPAVATTPRRMEALARALELASTRALIPKSRADQLQMAFMATDAQGRSWTIGLGSERWNRLDGEKWVAGDPPPELFVDAELRAALESIEALSAGRVEAAVAAPPPIPAPAVASDAPAVPEEHQRFAGPVAGPLAPRTPASPPASIAPTLSAAPIEMEDDWSHVVLCIVLAACFVALGFWKADGRGFAAAGLFAVLTVILAVINLAQSRHH